MIIKSIILNNFKNFQNEHTLDLMPESSTNHNIILIGGKNGAGKTTIFEAIKLCLFGRFLNGASLSNSNYEDYISSLMNKTASDKGEKKFYIKLELEINESFPTYTLNLERQWELDNKNIHEQFNIERDGMPLEIVPKEHWADYIISLIPPHISNYFFFDGEKVKELATGNNAERVLKESVREIIGLNLYDTLFDDLTKVIKKIRHRNIEQNEISHELSAAEKEQLELECTLSNIDANILEKGEQIKALQSELYDLEEKLRRTAGTYAKERKQNERELLDIKEKLSAVDEQIKEICNDMLPFTIATELNKKLSIQLEKEKQFKNLEASRNFIENSKSEILSRLGSKKSLATFPKKNLDLILKELNKVFLEISKENKEISKDVILHDLSSSVCDSILFSLTNIEKDLKRNLEIYLKRREALLLKTKKVRNKLSQVPRDEFVKEYIQAMATVQSQIETLEKDISALVERKEQISQQKITIENKIKNFEESIFCQAQDERKVDLSNTIQNIVKEYTNSIISFEIEELETCISEMYKRLANKDDMVKEIKIDEDTFSTSLLDYNGDVFNKNNISAGEKEIYAISVLWGLSRLSNRKLPIIIDSPLAKLDSTHVKNILTEFFPKAADQVIIFSHDLEIDKNAYKTLKPNINKEYTLSLKNMEKIEMGYFLKEFNYVN